MSGLAFLVPGPGTGPVIPLPVHVYDLGVAGFDRRFEAETLDVGTVTSWADLGSAPIPLALKAGSAGTAKKYAAADGGADGYVRVDTTAGSASLTDNTAIAGGSRTIAAVCRLAVGTSASSGALLKHAGASIQRASNQAAQAKSDTGTGWVTVAGQNLAIGTWRFLLIQVDATTPLFRAGGVESSVLATGTWILGSGSALELTIPYTSGTPRVVDWASVVEFPRLLNSAERDTLYAAYKARFTSLAL